MKKKGKGKPRGMNYADVLRARRDRLQLAMDEAALLNVEQSMQRYLWLMAVSLHDAYGFGPERLQKFFEAFQENSDELAKMRAEVDDDYAFEKLRLRAEDVSRMDIRYYGKLKIDLVELIHECKEMGIADEYREPLRRGKAGLQADGGIRQGYERGK